MFVSPRVSVVFLAGVAMLAGCSSDPGDSTSPPPIEFANTPCISDTVTLAALAVRRVDCSTGTNITLAGNGASYMVVTQFATNAVTNTPIPYTLSTGSVAAASLSGQRAALRAPVSSMAVSQPALAGAPGSLQYTFAHSLLARESAGARPTIAAARVGANLVVVPPVGSTRSFHVPSNSTGAFKTVTATLVFVGSNLLLYVDNNAPSNGFTPTQLGNFGTLFDQTFYQLVVNAFGPPSDIDGNGHVIMLMSPVVNGVSPGALCATQGYVAGFFAPEDLNGSSDANSNQGEIFYSIVPDPSATASCAHTVDDVGRGVPGTFVHELQHLINFTQHEVVNQTAALASWLDEGMSIVAEELGSEYYENKCPTPACRSTPSQLFPDSSQGFAQSFLFDSYQYALLPDSASITLHSDSDDGFSWRGGAWLLAHYLGDQFGTSVYKSLETGPSNGVTAIATATGQPFPVTFANFGLALYADSFPGLPRTTAPDVNRFKTRNLRQLWARLFVTSNSTTIPLEMPLTLSPITTDTSTYVMSPGTMSFWRLDIPAGQATATIRFANSGGGAFNATLVPQVAILRLPAGQ
jgi:hypothetical protein